MKALKLFAAVCCLMMMMSFAAPLSDRCIRFVDRVEKNCEGWDEKGWEKAQLEYQELMADFREKADNMTQDEREGVYKCIGRYKGLSLKYFMTKAEYKAEEMKNTFPSIVEGFLSVFEVK